MNRAPKIHDTRGMLVGPRWSGHAGRATLVGPKRVLGESAERASLKEVDHVDPSPRAQFIMSVLDELFPELAIPLQHRDPYTLLVAVVLSAQCTDKRVNLVTPRLFAQAATPAEMVVLSITQIEETIASCGLAKRKAHAIWHLSDRLLRQHAGRVPDDEEALESLPGVGHKTASVVRSQAFGHPAFPVDTHIHRLARRWSISDGKNVRQTERDLKAFFPQSRWNRLHLQMITYGRSYCPARGHRLESCPICRGLQERNMAS